MPSFLSIVPVGESCVNFDGSRDNVRLRLGEVQEIVYPDNENSRSRELIEYRVWVHHRENGTAVNTMYENCLVVNLFGGGADRFSYTLRADFSARRAGEKESTLSKGAKVLLLCLHGETRSAYIVGGVRDAGAKEKKADGHNLHFEFNGVQVTIDREGQLALTVKGATDADGKPAKNSDLPSSIKLTKDGKITATVPGGNSLVMDCAGTVTITSEKEFNVVCNGTAKISATNKCTVVAKIIELGAEGIGGVPPAGVVLGSGIDTLTGCPYFALGSTSAVVFARK